MDATNINTSTEYLSIVKSGAVTPNFRQLVDEGVFLPPLNYYLEMDKGDKANLGVLYNSYNDGFGHGWNYTFWDAYGSMHVVPPGQWSGYCFRYKPSSSVRVSAILDPLSSSEISAAYKKFDNNMLLKLKGQSLPVLMALKERKETGALITSFLQKGLDAAQVIRHPKLFFKRLRGRNPTTAEGRRLNKIHQRLLRKSRSQRVSIADAYLQYRFAWSPLVADIRDFVEGAEKAMKKGISKSARKGINYQRSYVDPLTSLQGNLPGISAEVDISITGHQKIFYSIDDVSAAAYSQMQSIGATLWDSVSYSFIIDGLVNISKYLECSNATLGLRFNSGYKSIKVICVTKLHYGGPVSKLDPGAVSSLAKTSGPIGRYQLKVTRQVLTDFPVPTLEFPYEDYLSAVHVADLAALLKQKLKRSY